VLGKLARQHDPNVLVGFDRADDAGVYLTLPIRRWCRRSIFLRRSSTTPTPSDRSRRQILERRLCHGGKPSLRWLWCASGKADSKYSADSGGRFVEDDRSGCTVIGGHSIRDEETKFGYSVTGMVHPKKVLANKGARPGDALLLTKAIGTGVISTAIKKGKAEPAWIEAAVRSMTTLNKQAAETITAGNFRVSSMTDVTGFGLIGHAREMCWRRRSINIHAGKIP